MARRRTGLKAMAVPRGTRRYNRRAPIRVRWLQGFASAVFAGATMVFAAKNPTKGFLGVFPTLHREVLVALAQEWTLSGRAGIVKERGFLVDVSVVEVATWAITSRALRGLHQGVIEDALYEAQAQRSFRPAA